MQTTSNIYCSRIINLLSQHGVTAAYCSPGSRNTPLLVALDAVESIAKTVVVDERSAAFQALGYSLVKRSPVLLVCTSGSAVLNYAPAIAEAYYAGVPLIVVSADRPQEWIDQDDSQTIRQFGVLSHIVKGSYDIRAIPEGSGREYTEEMGWYVNRTVNEAVTKALEGKPGPVHINVQLAEPLGLLAESEPRAERKVSLIGASDQLAPAMLRHYSSAAAGAKILVVAGFSAPSHKLRVALERFASLPNVTVMAETISNLNDTQSMSAMIDSVLCRMTAEDKEKMRPDIVISMGGALVSRMLKQYLRDFPPSMHWSVGHSNYFCDCFKAVTDIFDISPERFFSQMHHAMVRSAVPATPDYSAQWRRMREEALEWSERYIEGAPWSDLKAIHYLLGNLRLDNLFVSNGTAVRYSQLIPHRCHAEYCNRGVSGIDGCTSTAVGGAAAYSGQTTLLTGDMSWLYDSGCSTLGAVSEKMRIIVIDNSGGGIFRFIKSTSGLPAETLDRYLCVADMPDVAPVAEAYGIEVFEASCMAELADGAEWLQQESDLPRLLIVRTPPEESAEVLRNYFSRSSSTYSDKK
ncbi:MAG: 2-succinyl-5-enolpyruvyl-6-hydroxy-3-cyclohexene-1-carboxylic-acid synthase [Bacteroidales bacterium]|nr:2-succinyl-5-enolpyruvyl-6-hydroxy-3-cyclohexene-1-carboxylic-acid synthase [Bacteroidales bacterium]